MSVYTDILAVEAEIVLLESSLGDARSRLQALLAQWAGEGPDVSSNQGEVDWAQVPSRFAFHRIADGDIRDARWTSARLQAMRAESIATGPYYFARVAAPTNRERNGKSEAAMAVYFSESAGWGQAGDLPLAYDFETLNGQAPAKAAAHVVEFARAYRYLKGHQPIIYTNPGTWNLVLPELGDSDKTWIAGCPLWVAHWNVSAPSVPAPWADWKFWQYTNTGSLPGIAGSVDLNRFAGTSAELDALRL